MFSLDRGKEHGLAHSDTRWGTLSRRATYWILAYTRLTCFLKNRNLERISKHLEPRILCSRISYDRRCVLFENAKGKPQRHAPGGHPAPAPSASSSDVTIRKETSLTAKTIERTLPAHFRCGESWKRYPYLTFSYFKSLSSLEEKSSPEFGAKSAHRGGIRCIPWDLGHWPHAQKSTSY